MFFGINKPCLYDKPDIFVTKGTLLIAIETDHDLTAGRVYAATKRQGDGTFFNCIFVINDKGVEQDYTNEYFALYEGERVCESVGGE